MRFIISTIAGVIIGLMMAACSIEPFSSMTDSNPIGLIYTTVNFPAQFICQTWWHFRLPPHGEAGLVMLPVSVLVQWILLGIIIGTLLQIKYKRKETMPNHTDSPNVETP